MNKKFKSFKKLLEKSDINPNQRNKDGTTTYGVLFYHSQTQFYIDEGYKNMSVGDTMTAGMLGSQAIDALNPPPPEGQIMNIPQVASKGSTPRQSTQANPLAITVPGNELSREDLKKLYEERMYG